MRNRITARTIITIVATSRFGPLLFAGSFKLSLFVDPTVSAVFAVVDSFELMVGELVDSNVVVVSTPLFV